MAEHVMWILGDIHFFLKLCVCVYNALKTLFILPGHDLHVIAWSRSGISVK